MINSALAALIGLLLAIFLIIKKIVIQLDCFVHVMTHGHDGDVGSLVILWDMQHFPVATVISLERIIIDTFLIFELKEFKARELIVISLFVIYLHLGID